MLWTISVCTVLLLPAGSHAALAQDNEELFFADAESRALYKDAYEAVLSEDWERARKGFDAVLVHPSKSRLRDDAAFWRCYVMEKSGEPPRQAYDCFKTMRSEYPESQWADDAQLRSASNLARVAASLPDDERPAVDATIRAMQDDANDEVAVTAIHALARTGSSDAIPALERVLARNTSSNVRHAVAYALHRIGTDEAKDLLETMILSDEEEVKVRVGAIMALSALDDPSAVATFIQVLETAEDPGMRRAAVSSLQRLGTAEAAQGLRDHLRRERHPGTLRVTVLAFAEITDDQPIGTLLEVFRTSDAEEAQVAVVQALHRMRSAPAMAAIMELLEEADAPRVRREAVAALAEPGNDRAVDILTDVALNDFDKDVRRSAVEALGRIDTARSRAALERVIGESLGGN